MFRTVLFFILVFLIVAFGFGQNPVHNDPYLKFDHLTSKNGLSNNYVLDIHQDREGFLWIATREGLNRFDGYNVRQFFSVQGDSGSLSSNLTTCLEEDISGNLWVGTDKGLNTFNPSSLQFKNLNNSPDSIYTDHHIRAILQDQEILWAETADGELWKMLHNNSKKVFQHTKPSMVNTYFYHSMLHDPKGNIWLGGRYMGLYCFDPLNEKFSRVENDPADPSKKRDNDVAVYYIDSKGNFWVGGIDGLYTFHQETGIFTRMLAISTFSLAEDEGGKIWIGTGSGLFIYDPKKNAFSQSIHDDNNRNSLIHNHINKIFIDISGNVWIGTLDGISIFRPSKNKFRHIYHIPELNNTPVSSHIIAIMEDPDGNLWIGMAEKGVDVFNPLLVKTASFSASKKGIHQLASDRISVIKQDAEGDVWVGQWSGRGMNILNPKTQKNVHFRFLPGALMADWYSDILHDSKGNHWLGLWGAQGLYRYDKVHNQIGEERYDPFPVKNGSIRKLVSDGRRVWIAYASQDQFYCYDLKAQRLQSYRRENYYGYAFNKILDIVKHQGKLLFITNKGTYELTETPWPEFKLTDNPFLRTNHGEPEYNTVRWLDDSIPANVVITEKNGTTWAGTGRGLIRKDTREVTCYNRLSVPEGWVSDTIWDIEIIHDDMLLLGTEKGLVKHDRSTGLFSPVTGHDDRYLSSHLVKFIFEDSEGFLWVGTTDQGLNRFNPATGEILRFGDDPADSSAFWGQQASCAVEDDKGSLWFGGMGLNKFNRDAADFTHITKDNGLAGNHIMALQPDDEGNLWISTSTGLSCYHAETGKIRNYYEKDGLQDNEFTAASFKLSNGYLAFGGKNGLNVFDPVKIWTNEHPPEVKLTGFSIFEEPRTDQLREGKSIELKHRQNYFSFEFTALDFSDPENNAFTYTLENFDENWIRTGAENRVARYTNVDPGKYVFRVKASNSDGVWNETGVSIPVIIHPPFWRTGFFYGLLSVFILSILFLFIKYREKKINDQNRVLLLEQRLLRSQMNPHFIFNSLSSIQSFIFENNPVTAGSYLSRFAELIRSILYNSREELITLEKEMQTLKNYLELQQLRYNNAFDYTIDTDPSIDPEELAIPPMLAQPFIENAIEHGIKHIAGRGKISILFRLEEDRLLLMLEDNGIGLEAAKKLKNSKAGEHRSLATIITKERIRILNKSQRKNKYSVEISEINEGGVIRGTRVKFILPELKTDPDLTKG